ncbi:hypothetical protein SAMN05443094_10226 [Domibacillus enclensis]|uniref:Uncharacterized protein n=1 Tax=Domibacillus enclensis TaxID=1017273 RepID=A0A1N6R6D2_9BACI|nr:hypothetical protein SAMN05443094_10226 [Domibacillus enclensis]
MVPMTCKSPGVLSPGDLHVLAHALMHCFQFTPFLPDPATEESRIMESSQFRHI